MFSFQGASEFLSSRDSMKHLLSKAASVNPFSWWRLAGSNRWPPACKAGALPAELNPHLYASLLVLFYQLKAQRSGFQLERRSRFAREHFAFRRNAEFAKRTSTSWWAKMDSLSCGKATPVETVHWTVSKCRLSSPSQTLQSFWWAKMDSNHRPHDYQSCALASWAIGPYLVASSCSGSFSSVPSKLNNAIPNSLPLYWP